VLRRAALAESAFEVELERPRDFTFAAGQSIRVYFGGEGRDYSLAGSPSAQTLLLVVRRIAGGAVSPALEAAAPGSSLDFTGPHGVFTFKPSARPVVLVATGVGIAPFLSMVRSGTTGFTLLHGVRSADELFYRRELEAAAARYVPCLSRQASAGCFSGRVTAWARDHLAAQSSDFYLCGGRRMVRDVILLVDERFPGSRVYTEIFFQ
jgi:benzoate/toluate 1,2-dioxygenase reductase subunit